MFSSNTRETLLVSGEGCGGSVLTPATYRFDPVSVTGQDCSEEQMEYWSGVLVMLGWS